MTSDLHHSPAWMRILLQHLGDAAVKSRRGRRTYLLRRIINRPGRHG
ncbi:MAG: hypothetical protein PVI92_13890 [Chromatiales bacterium]